MEVQAVNETIPSYWKNAPIQRCTLEDSERLNREILAGFLALGPQDFERRTHYFGGRYENLYLERSRMPALDELLSRVLGCAAKILGRPEEGLRCGFWFNAMGPGQSTSEHSHDENDELLSAVYYVDAPDSSGDLLLYDGPLDIRVAPEPGALLFFPPDLPHGVAENQSGRLRLSIGINIGPLPSRQ